MASNGVLTAFVIITALAVVMQACILLVMAIGARKTQTQAMAIVEELRASLTPILATTRQVLEDSAPKIKNITANLEHGSEVLRDQSDNLQAAMNDVVSRSRRHVEHADMIVAEALDTVDQTRASVSHLLAQPLKWATAITNGLRAGLENYMGRKRANGEGYATHAAYEPESEEIFD
jgi:ElaB/YqjD/DUF883 family membrane-anchored ribosome-binding protein